MTLVNTLSLWGVQLPDDVVELAATAGLPLVVAVSLLDQESAGGHNVWGSDGVSTGGVYIKGAPVTRETYLAYKTLRQAGRIGNQGVGPCQLTATGYQDQADALGGCWIPRNNMLVGFRVMADLIRRYGTSDGIRRYNGSGPWAETYRAQMLARINTWTARLGTGGVIAPTPAPRPSVPTQEGDDLMTAISINVNPGLSFHEAIGAEAGGGSAVASSGWVTWGSTYGGTTWKVAALGMDGAVLGYWPDVRTTNNQQTSRPLPDGTRCVTIEGQVDNEGTRPWAAVWCLR
jgi:hypothetical protein